MWECEACGEQIKPGEEMVKVTDMVLSSPNVAQINNTWTYHAKHVSIAHRGTDD